MIEVTAFALTALNFKAALAILLRAKWLLLFEFRDKQKQEEGLIENGIKMKNVIVCQFSAARSKTITAARLFADRSGNLRQAKCQIYNIGV